MANKSLDTKIDIGAMNEIIVHGQQYKNEMSAAAGEIRSICQQMSEDESLAGGDGEQIKANFATIAEGCTNLEKSLEYIMKILNEKLAPAIEMRRGATLGDSTEVAKSATDKVGVFKD